MRKYNRLKYYMLKSLKETFLILSLNLILIFLAMKFSDSAISFLLKSLGYGIVIVGVIIFFVCYIVTFSINYVYGEMDFKVKKEKK